MIRSLRLKLLKEREYYYRRFQVLRFFLMITALALMVAGLATKLMVSKSIPAGGQQKVFFDAWGMRDAHGTFTYARQLCNSMRRQLEGVAGCGICCIVFQIASIVVASYELIHCGFPDQQKYWSYVLNTVFICFAIAFASCGWSITYTLFYAETCYTYQPQKKDNMALGSGFYLQLFGFIVQVIFVSVAHYYTCWLQLKVAEEKEVFEFFHVKGGIDGLAKRGKRTVPVNLPGEGGGGAVSRRGSGFGGGDNQHYLSNNGEFEDRDPTGNSVHNEDDLAQYPSLAGVGGSAGAAGGSPAFSINTPALMQGGGGGATNAHGNNTMMVLPNGGARAGAPSQGAGTESSPFSGMVTTSGGNPDAFASGDMSTGGGYNYNYAAANR